ncbi:HD domain-containing protein [uncultured Cedecea sp.]|uniref:HD domain-containing protein n=1 Tax=uncultured Cedecea sp. TaxID=988762 RepID=UPI002601A67A|nr:HD domain-containing protein [uncultured Cedecea sp.]
MELENKIINYLKKEMIEHKDAAHDLGHLTRVAEKSKHIHKYEGGNLDVIIIASYFHDIVALPKNSFFRHYSSIFSAQKTIKIFKEHFQEISVNLYGQISDVIRSHSYRAGIKPVTIEAKIVQDADRLDALGAIGLARVFYVAGKLGQRIYSEDDPFAAGRLLNDKKYALYPK